VDISDLQTLLTNFNTSVTLSYSELAGIDGLAGEFGEVALPNLAGDGLTLVAVPEPVSGGSAVVCALALLGRRVRRIPR
jgi:hypothetical protein